MENYTYISGLITALLALIQLAVLIVGLVTAAIHREKHPRVSLLVMIALSLMIMALVVSFFSPVIAVQLLGYFGQGDEGFKNFMLIQSFFSGLARIAAVTMLIIAALGWRDHNDQIADQDQHSSVQQTHSHNDLDQE